MEVEANGETAIWIEPSVPLPEHLSFSDYDTSTTQGKDTLDYLLEQYQAVVDMAEPAQDLFGDYNIYGQYGFSYGAYENSGDLTDRILAYNFNRITFSPDDDGKLWIIRRSSVDLSRKIGDYPIITPAEAEKLLMNKQFISSVDEPVKGQEYVAAVELVYRTSRFDSVFMPYYKFLVELPDMERENGLKIYGAYYVPAVQAKFLSNVPLWDGSFN